jgi:hypothetical protein
MATDGFFPIGIYGNAESSITRIYDTLPIITFCISFVSSSFGMTKFFINGPLKILPKNAFLSGILSLRFLTLLILNTIFASRIYAIEAIFFSRYLSRDSYDYWTTTIESIASEKYRLLYYFTPVVPSFLLNIFILKQTLTFGDIGNLFLKYPQMIIGPCFTPIVYEGKRAENGIININVWKLGTILNGLYIGCFPLLSLIISDIARGITLHDFDTNFKSNNAVCQGKYCNLTVASIALPIYTFILIFAVLGENMFSTCKTRYLNVVSITYYPILSLLTMYQQ